MVRILKTQYQSRPLTHVKFNRDGDLLFSTAKDGFLSCLDATTGNRLARYGPSPAVFRCDVTHDTREAVSASFERITRYDILTGAIIEARDIAGACKFVEYNREPLNQNRMLAVCGKMGPQGVDCVKLFARSDGGISEQIAEIMSDLPPGCNRAHWGPFDETIICGHSSGLVSVWDVKTMSKIKEFTANSKELKNAAVSKDGLLLLTCGGNDAKLWDTVNFNCLKEYTLERPLNCCDISPLCNDPDESLRRSHIMLAGGVQAEQVAKVGEHEHRFDAVLFHMIYGHEIGQIKGHFGTVNTVNFKSDGTGYASGAEDGTLLIGQFDQDYWTKFD